jgi:hypothetical protein
MNNAPPAAGMPAAGTQALLSIRPGGQRLAGREVLAGRDRLERLGVAPKQTSSTESAICACRAALTLRDVRDAAWLPHSMASAAMGFELTETAGTPCVEAGMPAP